MVLRRKLGGSAARVSATEAAKSFGRIVDRVRETRETYIVERAGVPVVRIDPVSSDTFTLAAFKALVARLPRADAPYLDAVERAASARHGPRARRNPWEH